MDEFHFYGPEKFFHITYRARNDETGECDPRQHSGPEQLWHRGPNRKKDGGTESHKVSSWAGWEV